MTTTTNRIITAIGAWLRPLLDLPLYVLLLALGLGLFVVGQQPLNYDVSLGQEDGWDSDQPFIYNWNTTESTESIRFRWTRDESAIVLAGIPHHPVALNLDLLPATANPAFADGVVGLSVAPEAAAVFPMSVGERQIHMIVGADAVADDTLDLVLTVPSWEPANDPRTLGIPVDHLGLTSLVAAPSLFGFMPASLAFLWPLFVLVVVWVPLRRCGTPLLAATVLGVAMVALLMAAMAVDRPRFALVPRPTLIATAWAAVWSLGLRWALGGLVRRLSIPATPALLNFLVLLFFVSFAMRYTGRLYPLSMPGDLGFHINREHDVIRGLIRIVSRHRGIDFPYPPALYIMLMPFRLLPIEAHQLVEFTDALFGSLGIFPLGYLALKATNDERAARWSALTYALLAPAMMSLWWSFQPHIFAQELAVWLFAGIAWGWAALATRRGVMFAAAGLILLFSSHFGFYLNVSVMLCVIFATAIIAQRRPWVATRRASLIGLFWAFVLAQVFVLLLFYSSYAGLIINKLLEFEQGGMGAVQGGRVATTQADLWRTLWGAGLGIHYATIGVPLMVLGGYRLWALRDRSVVPMLFGATLVVAVVQGAIPFLTSSTITTRWLSFAAWIVAIGVGLFLNALWQRGRSGRVLAIAVVVWIGWLTLMIWVSALGYRIRPPEPF